MIDHVSIGVRDIARSKRFYDAALKPLGYVCLSQGEGSLGYGRGTVALWMRLTPPRETPISNDQEARAESGPFAASHAAMAVSLAASASRQAGRAAK